MDVSYGLLRLYALVMAFFILLSCLSALVLAAILYAAVIQLISDAENHLPPGPWPFPVIGNVLHMSKLPHRSLARLAERYGPLMTVRLGTSLYIVASSPSTAREILQRHNASLSGRSPADAWRGGGHGDNSIFVLQPRRKWRMLRRLGAAHLFSPQRLQALQSLRQQVVCSRLLRDVLASVETGSLVSVRRVAFNAMVSLLWRAMFSNELDETAGQGLQDCVRAAMDLLMTPNVSDLFPFLADADIQGVRRRVAILIGKVYQLIDQQINHRMKSSHGFSSEHRTNDDLLDVMLNMSEQHDHSGATINRDVMRAFFTVSIIIYYCHIYYAKVEDYDIDRLPYLQAVIKETLRLHSVVPMMSYRADATVQVQGYTIPEGSNVLVNVWAIHHNADVWTEPHRFIPERFLHREVDFFGRSFHFLPFGSGRHMCLGLPLANRMLNMMLGSLLHRFDWMLPEDVDRTDVDMKEKFGLVLSIATPIQVIAKKKM
ncbi:hypothetical protein PR202_ga01621 [Eleusine coracana subsp. coracana]|uniref:Uncharacterized protein n=1 Tax=Eleusine coracana subsp. coracana TaxID=191504 RepID=A0AAV5BHW8_ELECO|nr:hypothetical protein PR202_ga00934 [Eleusine coracana subsp. coracana]GJM85821.1 hypothetical protein PR202_ga01621 [Eleusine coracana subsp. coracana]